MSVGLLASLTLLLALLPGLAAAAFDTPIAAGDPPQTPIGRHAAYLQETHGRLTLEQAIAAYRSGKYSAGRHQVLTFGIGPKPVWIHFSVRNTVAVPLRRRLSIATAWLDHVDVYFRHGGDTVAAYQVGDTQPYDQRPVDSRDFAFDHDFDPGVSDVFVRVQTPDPMVVPMYLMPLRQALNQQQKQNYSYGFLYGFLFALLAYNVMLYAGLRDARYILYSLYLGMFLLMNISYTGHGFRWLWPTHPAWEQWSNPVFMMLYAASGLVFALSFLDTRTHFPRIHKGVLGYLGVSFALLALTVLSDSQRLALLLAFTFVFLFTGIMLAMGIVAVRSGQKPARYFLLAAMSAMIGAAVTALAVWGFIRFNIWTFRAVDIGVLLDATLLALALTYQFRVGQAEKLRAERLAWQDSLTGLNNRRAFYAKTTPIWNVALRHGHDLAVVLLDLDGFKRINDAYGHAYGDEVLMATAEVLTETIREQDVAARWGGEEFIVLLPETDLDEACALAERLRIAMVGIRLRHTDIEPVVTASFGVAQRQRHHHDLDAVISSADKYLYQAKDMGRNRISCA
ncbi:MAG: sensor domain-containing diguanylate cyclase [Gammaproteobacteria bacterium]